MSFLSNISTPHIEENKQLCTYIYDGHEFPCLNGRRKAGDRCTFIATHGKFCGYHDPEGELKTGIPVPLNGPSSRATMLNNAIDKSFDFEETFHLMRGENPYPGEPDGLEKYLLVLWTVSPEIGRKPTTIVGLSSLLERSITQLNSWLRSPFIKKIIESERVRLNYFHQLRIDAILAEKALAGEPWAVKLFMNQSPGGKAGENLDVKMGKKAESAKVSITKMAIGDTTRTLIGDIRKGDRLPGVRFKISNKAITKKAQVDEDGNDDA